MHRHDDPRHVVQEQNEITILEVDGNKPTLEAGRDDESASSKAPYSKAEVAEVEVEKIAAREDGLGIGLPDSGRSAPNSIIEGFELDGAPRYRLYKRRFAGVLGIIVLNIIGGMNWPWFGPIANNGKWRDT